MLLFGPAFLLHFFLSFLLALFGDIFLNNGEGGGQGRAGACREACQGRAGRGAWRCAGMRVGRAPGCVCVAFFPRLSHFFRAKYKTLLPFFRGVCVCVIVSPSTACCCQKER